MSDPLSKNDLKGINLSYEGVAGSVQAFDVALRDLYKASTLKESTDALKRLKYTRSLAPNDAPWAAKSLSEFRNLLRKATQEKSTPIGKAVAKWLEKNRAWSEIIKKYGDPFDYTKSSADRLASAEKIIEKSGSSSARMNGIQLFGKALLVINVITCVGLVKDGIEKQGTNDAAVGKVDIAEGATNAMLGVGTYIATKKGWISAAGGWAALGASVLAMGSLSLASEEARRSARGEKTMVLVASDYYTDLYERGGKEGGFSGRAKQAGALVGGVFTWPMAWLQTAGEMK